MAARTGLDKLDVGGGYVLLLARLERLCEDANDRAIGRDGARDARA